MITKTKPSGFKNKLFYGDNLDILRYKIDPATVDLCYIDPPFNSKRNYFQIYNNIGTEGDKAQSQAFMDTWEWGDEAIEGFEYITNLTNQAKFTPQTVALIKGLEQVLKRGSLFAYLVHMTLRIVEIHRVLKPTGSFYLHCDPTASHYLKLVCDSVFCAGGNGGNFLNEIIWSYRTGGMSKKWFGRKHDVVLLYAKSKSDHLFNLQREKSYLTHKYGFTNVEILQEPPPDSRYYTLAGMRDVWAIDALRGNQPETQGYPTQKPEALLERVIKASSNEGDVVLDAYCGCGTTVAVAQRLKRHWIGIDITYQSISLILKRLEDNYKGKSKEWTKIKDALHLDGVPRDMASAIALANRKDDKTRKEFEKWAVLTYSNNQAHINDKKGGDGGIDGTAFFLKDKGVNGKAILSVKSDRAVQPAYVDQLAGTVSRDGADLGILLCLNKPSKGVYERAKEYGKYEHPMLKRVEDKIQIVTVFDIFEDKRLDLPMAREDVVKSAPAVGDSDNQIGLA